MLCLEHTLDRDRGSAIQKRKLLKKKEKKKFYSEFYFVLSNFNNSKIEIIFNL